MHSPQPQPNMLPEQDSELLSAYLDNQLNSGEQAAVERRLQQEPALRNELGELRAAVSALRQLEAVRPPRSFTLDPAMVRRPRPLFSLSWLMQFGSSLAGLVLILLATLQLLGSGPQPAMTAMEVVATQPAPMAAPAPEAADLAPMLAAPEELPEPAMAQRITEDEDTLEAEIIIGQGLNAPEAAEPPGLSGGSSAPLPPMAAAPPHLSAAQEQRSTLPPSLMLALGFILVGLGVSGYLYSRRQKRL